MTDWKTYAKAIAGALIAGLTALTTALADGNISTADIAIILGALVAGFGGVYAVPNAVRAVRRTSG